MRHVWVFSPEKFSTFAAKKLGVAFVEYSGAKEYLETRTQHAPHGHLSALKTDCNPTSMPRREYQSSRVCVPPGGTPEGILDVAEYIVCVELFFFLFVLVFYYPAPFFFRRKDQCRKFNCRAARRKKKHRRERETF